MAVAQTATKPAVHTQCNAMKIQVFAWNASHQVTVLTIIFVQCTMSANQGAAHVKSAEVRYLHTMCPLIKRVFLYDVNRNSLIQNIH